MASPPFNIAQAEPAASDFISQYPTNEQTNRDVIESWLLLISTNLGVLRADAMPDSFDAGMDFITSITISAADTNGNTSVIFRDELDVVQAEVVWDESEDALKLIKYEDDGTTPSGTLIMGEDETLTFNGSNVIRANSALATAITGTGALNAGSITSGFGSIDIGTDTLAAGNTTITGTGSFSGVLSALASIELGHASDTTVARAAAGFMSVEGKRVPSPASQAQGDILVRGATEWERLAVGAYGQVPRINAAATALEYTGAGAPDAVLEDRKAAGTDGGTFTAGAWRTRDLNTEVKDTYNIVSISSDQFTPTVNGWVEWSAPCYEGNGHQTRLFNVTDGTLAGTGSPEIANESGTVQTRSVGGAAVVAGKAYRVEHQCTITQNTTGFGRAANFGASEVYTRVKLWRT